MNIKPLHDHVIVKPITVSEVTASGIVLPETVSKERSEKGEVVAVGPGRFSKHGERIPMSVSVGDTVMFKKYSPDEIEVDGEELLVIKEGDIMAVLN